VADFFSAFNLLVALFLVLLNGFFVAVEFALVKIRPTRVETLIEEGKPAATLVKDAIQNLDGYLAACQLGITLSSLSLGWIGEPAIAALIEPVLGAFLPEGAIHTVAVVLGFGTITFLHVVFGELAPKTLSIQDAERISLIVAPPMKFFYYLFLPGIYVFNGTANFFTGLIGFSPASETDEAHTEEDIRMLIAQSSEHGLVEEGQEEMIEGVFELQDTAVREIMVPRPDVEVLETNMSMETLLAVTTEGSYSSYPVLDSEADDQVVGAIHVADLYRTLQSGDDSWTARDLAREVVIVPETRRIASLLTEFQEREIQMAIVIDEWGVFEGIVTMEDILEEIVGEIRDEFDVADDEPSITKLEDGGYSIDGRVPIETVNQVLDTEFGNEESETVGGLVFTRLGRSPDVGDSVNLDSYVFEVDEVNGNRISHIVTRKATQQNVDSSE
jgi:CBS domain containing-hemolysin-like protein